jgi:hypothetical protein
MFKVKVQGQYIARSGVMNNERIVKDYEIEGNIPTMTAALSIVKNKLLAPALAAKYADYIAYRTYHIVEVTPLTEQSKAEFSKKEVAYMSREAIVQHVKENRIGACEAEVTVGVDERNKPIKKTVTYPMLDVRYYPDLFKLREAVASAKEDPVGYHKNFASHKEELELDLQMAAANPELFKQKVDPTLAASIQTGSSKKAPSAPALAKQTTDRVNALGADQTRDGELGPQEPETNLNDL